MKDPGLLSHLHIEWLECALCWETSPLSLHHIHKHPRDDLRANLVMLCGSGTTGCHGRIEANDSVARRLLGEHLTSFRPDTLEYLTEKLGAQGSMEWMHQQFFRYAPV